MLIELENGNIAVINNERSFNDMGLESDSHMVEYFGRLDWDKVEKLREIVGIGEIGWKDAFPKLSKAKKLKFGEITFGKKVKKLWLTFERNVSSGFDIPVIHAEEL